MWNKVEKFEKTIADYAGSKYAIAMDSCTNAIFIAALWNKKIKPFETYNNIAELPKQTYISVAQSLRHAGYKLKFKDFKWKGYYPIEPLNIVDSACRFTEDMYFPNTYYCLSFHHRKILSTVRGGMILTDDKDFVKWARPMIYMGRNKDVKYVDDPLMVSGYNMYMSPETADFGTSMFDLTLPVNEDIADNNHYKDISNLDWYDD
jgi:dTDP-4-amino-4,6-dideoxygalactose transaminase